MITAIKNLIKSLKTIIVSIIIGIAIGIACSFAFYHYVHKDTADIKQITAQTISGSPLTVNEVKNKGKNTSIGVSYSGAGESIITVPNKEIPSANKWDSYHYGIGGMISTNLQYSIVGSYRYDRFQALGSIWCKNNNGYEFGASIGAMYLFDLNFKN